MTKNTMSYGQEMDLPGRRDRIRAGSHAEDKRPHLMRRRSSSLRTWHAMHAYYKWFGNTLFAPNNTDNSTAQILKFLVETLQTAQDSAWTVECALMVHANAARVSRATSAKLKNTSLTALAIQNTWSTSFSSLLWYWQLLHWWPVHIFYSDQPIVWYRTWDLRTSLDTIQTTWVEHRTLTYTDLRDTDRTNTLHSTELLIVNVILVIKSIYKI